MKPSRVLYVLAGASLALAVNLPVPGPGGFFAFVLVGSMIGALAFDWNDA